jgi:hypothetical protein
VTLTPVVLAGVLKARGQLGPAEIPHKRLFTYRFVQWSAQRHGIPLKWPPAHPFNPIKALRLSIALGNDPTVVRTIFRHLWREGRSLDNVGDWQSLCERLDATDADQRIGSPKDGGRLSRGCQFRWGKRRRRSQSAIPARRRTLDTALLASRRALFAHPNSVARMVRPMATIGSPGPGRMSSASPTNSTVPPSSAIANVLTG